MLKDGSMLQDEIIELADGIFKAQVAFSSGDSIPITWPEVTGLSTQDSITLVLVKGGILHGKAPFEKPGVIPHADRPGQPHHPHNSRFSSTFQNHWQYDNTPSSGTTPSDTPILLTLGHHNLFLARRKP